ncbi:tRNA (guanosine(46)-N7)-methyltransferase TrmB [Novipirellula artificiosorum]|uniref:tRNA (guanine-N(7)-)-methyltransferase n=1 Tax=Novipirellula artificiosorum TaxID=2528016 RepID=A0A5C6DTR2_9BACT|nr:tRNA (guanosine(46)-N7)-methyltransferase TrmB [Novipirellula artificiosorum]TWU38426.1 tRNA (guanine-N(7)-)-methyltransferase [Novipirellula artificiosorum]
MPRSPIRRPPADLDLSAVLRTRDDLPIQINSESVFGNGQPLEVEVGSGKGLFLTNASQSTPEHNFLGIEIQQKCAEHAAGRLAKAKVGNAIMVCGNAEPLFEERIAVGTLEAVHVYFPDPWWKKRQRKRRVVNETSIANIAKAIRPGGRFHFWTDVLDYFEQTVEMIAQIAPELGVPIPEEETEAQHDLDYHTHFERRSRKYRIPVYRVRYEKRG